MSEIAVVGRTSTDWARAKGAAVIAIGIGFLVFLAVAARSIDESRDLALAHAEREAKNLAQLIEEHATRAMGEVRATLDHVADRVAMEHRFDIKDKDALYRFVRDERAARGKQLRSLFVIDAAGIVLVDSEANPPRYLDASSFSDYLALRGDAAPDFYFGEPFHGRLTGLLTIVIARRLTAPDGSFAGVVSAAIDPGYFTAFYRGLDLGPDRLIGLIHVGGRVLAGDSRFTDLGDVHLAGDPLFMQRLPTARAGFFHGTFGTDAISRLVAYRQAQAFPMVAVAAPAEHDVLANWRRASLWLGAKVGLAALVVLGLGLVTNAWLRRLQRADHDLAEMANRFDLAVSGTGIAVWDWNLAEDKIWFSSTWFDMIGLTQDEPNTYRWNDNVHPDDLHRFSAAIARCVKGEDTEFRHLFRHADRKGNWLWIEAVGRCPPRNESREPRRLIGRLRDVTTQTQVEEALFRSEARFRDFAEASGEWLWETDANHRFIWLSSSVERATGVKPEWHYGKRRLDIATEDLALPHWQRHLDDLANCRSFHSFEFLRHGPDGPRWVRTSGTPVLDEDGRFIGYRGVGSDITALRLAELRLRDAVNSLPIGFVLFDHNDCIAMYNPAGMDTVAGLPAVLRVGRTFEDMMRDIIGCGLLPDALPNPESWLAERLGQHRNPGPPILLRYTGDRWAEVIERRTTDGGTILLRSDVTDRIDEQRRLSAAVERAESANRSKSTFLANMSHELRTPLNAISGFAEMIAGEFLGPAGNPKYRGYGADIRHSAEHLLALINQVLEMARVEASKRELHLESIDPGEMVRAVLQLVEHQAERRALKIEYVPSKTAPTLVADKLAMRQVLINLLSNAVKFTPPGGSIHVSSYRRSDFFVLEVSDTGIGIKADDLNRLGRPFEMAATDQASLLTSEHAGTGLGLALSKGLIELHGGTISIASEVGRGTTVTVSLPLHHAALDAAVA